jgi:hypothetical protein
MEVHIMRDRLLGRSLCCDSISATVFFEKALDFLLVGLDKCLTAVDLDHFAGNVRDVGSFHAQRSLIDDVRNVNKNVRISNAIFP